MLAPGGQCYNYSGCGNTFNCNHPVARQFIVDCLRYWVQEMHVDGFRRARACRAAGGGADRGGASQPQARGRGGDGCSRGAAGAAGAASRRRRRRRTARLACLHPRCRPLPHPL